LAHDSEVQEQFVDGILWAGLGPSPNLLGILSRWGALLGITTTKETKVRSREQWADLLHTVIGTRRMLLVIDDAWRLEDVLALRVGGPYCASVITTRVPATALRVSDDGIVVVPELSEDDSVHLLAHYIPDLVTRERSQLVPLVHAAGQLPLALMLMGRYLRVQGQGGNPRRIHAALTHLKDAEQRLRLQEPQAITNHHPSLPIQTPLSLHSVIAVSDQQLDDRARLALHALSIFPPKPNSFSEEAALVVTATSEEVLDQLSDAELLESSEPGRYTLHQTIADYAMDSLQEPGNQHRFVTYFVSYVEAHQRAYAELEQESENILAALQRAFEAGLHKELVQGIIAFIPYLRARGLYTLALLHLERANEAAHANNDLLGKINILLYLADILEPQGDYAQEETFLREALTLARQIEHQERLCACLARLGYLYCLQGDYAQAQVYLLEGLEIARQIQDQDRLSSLLVGLGIVAYEQGNYPQAESYLQEALVLARQIHHQERVSAVLINLGGIVYEQGQWIQAENYFQEALTLARQMGQREHISTLLLNLGEVVQRQGRLAQAEAYCQEGLLLARQSQRRVVMLLLLTTLATIATKEGNYAQAETYLHEGLSAAPQIGNPKATSVLLLAQGELLLKQYHLEAAATAFYEAEVHVPEGQQEMTAQIQYGLARVTCEQGNAEEARRLGEVSLHTFEQIGHYMAKEVKEWLTKYLAKT
jgi:tetratricopeptide (TPR) repeat protein